MVALGSRSYSVYNTKLTGFQSIGAVRKPHLMRQFSGFQLR